MNEQFKFQRKGSLVVARGDGWSYESVHGLSVFTQNKKLPSLRVIKTLIKKLKESHNGKV